MNLKFIPLLFAAALAATLPAPAQSLWNDSVSKPMFADKRANSVGDILTIVVQESSSANKNNETKTEKNSSWTAAVTSFLFPGFLQFKGSTPAVNYNSDLKHDGSGAINNSETIVAQVAVKIIDVLPNRNLVIEGKRDTSFGDEHQTIILHGIVRADDVTAANTVLSYNVADATISILSDGSVTDSTKKGWFTRILGKVNPF
jgi:flagellar L-ring protein precursor FlgH